MALPRVLLVSKFYRRGGGDCTHVLALERLLRAKGHEVAVLAMSHPENIAAQRLYTAPRVGFDGPMSAKLAMAARCLGGAGVKDAARRAIADFRPDVVHLHNIHSYLSPAVGAVAAAAGIKVVWTLHDYKPVCPSYSMLCRGETCEACIAGPFPVFARRCLKGSAAASLVAFAEARRWSPRRLSRMTDAFICPSAFLASKMAAGGIDSSRLNVLNNFFDAPEASDGISGAAQPREGVCYVGRLSPEKGVDILLAAAEGAPWHLTVAGIGSEEQRLRERYGSMPNVTFAGSLDAAAVASLFARSRLSVIPSVCNENFPMAGIESLCAGTPVVAAAIGGLPELVDDPALLFEPRSSAALRSAVDRALAAHCSHTAIADRARSRFSADTYYTALCRIYSR